jgi:hypothetical protein
MSDKGRGVTTELDITVLGFVHARHA